MVEPVLAKKAHDLGKGFLVTASCVYEGGFESKSECKNFQRLEDENQLKDKELDDQSLKQGEPNYAPTNPLGKGIYMDRKVRNGEIVLKKGVWVDDKLDGEGLHISIKIDNNRDIAEPNISKATYQNGYPDRGKLKPLSSEDIPDYPQLEQQIKKFLAYANISTGTAIPKYH